MCFCWSNKRTYFLGTVPRQMSATGTHTNYCHLCAATSLQKHCKSSLLVRQRGELMLEKSFILCNPAPQSCTGLDTIVLRDALSLNTVILKHALLSCPYCPWAVALLPCTRLAQALIAEHMKPWRLWPHQLISVS